MKKFAMILSVLLLVQVNPICATTIQDKALSFIGGAPIPDEARKILLECVSKNAKKSEWLTESQSNIYSLKALEIPAAKNGNKFAQSSLDKNYTKRAELQATLSLAEYIDKGKLNRKIFKDKDAADYALRVYYSGKIKGGFQSASMIIDDVVFCLVWVQKNNLLSDSLSEKEITENYCTYLYNKAQYFFSNKDFKNALETFHQIHYMDWANIDSYLGASVCFLQMNQKDDAAKLASELVNVFSKDMAPDEMANAGKILFAAGKKDEGFNAMEQAYKMLATK